MTSWNPLVNAAHRLASPNHNARRPAQLSPTHVVLHVTGTDKLASVKHIFLAKNSVSAHYLIDKAGLVYQFVPEDRRAWHAGIDSGSRALYRRPGQAWRRYLKYFSWYKGYPSESVFVDADLRPVWDKSEAVFVARSDSSDWPEYNYFTARWSQAVVPIHFDVDADPNNYSIGIELLGYGAKTSDPAVYTPAMYQSLDHLLEDISARRGIPREKGRIVGHEDVHPVGRFGWDPAPGFDWSRVWG
jgi:N-acetyl-anhydromuramyl-L-alanine amidase AmpD